MIQDLVQNRKAFHDYEILDTFEAGIVLFGTEVKSLKGHHGSLQDAFITVKKKELWLIHSFIPPYSHGGIAFNHEERRERKLLMHKREIEKIQRQLEQKGLTVIPLAFYVKNGRIKVKVALAQGRKSYDKRAKIKEKESKRQIEKIIKQRS